MQPSKNTKSLSLRAPFYMRARQSCGLGAQHSRLPRCARNDGISIKNQQGVSIVAAIFLITALALLATAAVQLVATGQQSISQEITSVKAYFAGQTGLQWSMYQSVYTTPGSPQTLTLSNVGLSSTSAVIIFSSRTVDSNTYYQISSTGKYADTAAPEYSSRELNLRFKP